MKTKLTLSDGSVVNIRYEHIKGPDSQLGEDLVKDAIEKDQIKKYECKWLSDYCSKNPTCLQVADAFFPTAITICHFDKPAGDGRFEVVATGYSFCSYKDQFVKKVGRTKSYWRAVGELRKLGLSVVDNTKNV